MLERILTGKRLGALVLGCVLGAACGGGDEKKGGTGLPLPDAGTGGSSSGDSGGTGGDGSGGSASGGGGSSSGGSSGSGGAGGGSGGVDASIGGADGGDGGPDGAAGSGGFGGFADGSFMNGSGAFGPIIEAGPPVFECVLPTTFACRDFCSALLDNPDCATHVYPPPAIDPSQHPDPATIGAEELRARCECACEASYRTTTCRTSFDNFVMCGASPLAAICSTNPEFINDFPDIVGACGVERGTFLSCVGVTQ